MYREQRTARQRDSAEIVFSFKLAREGEIYFCVVIIIIIFFIVLMVNIERVYQFIGRLDSGLSIVDQL